VNVYGREKTVARSKKENQGRCLGKPWMIFSSANSDGLVTLLRSEAARQKKGEDFHVDP